MDHEPGPAHPADRPPDQPPYPQSTDDRREARAAAKAARARAKAMRPWYAKKRWWAVGAAIAIIVIAVVATAGENGETPSPQNGDAGDETVDATDTRNLDLYPDRPDRQDQDHEANVGGSVRLAGYTAAVTAAELTRDTVLGDQLTIFVEVQNRDESAQPYNIFDWRLQDEGGRVIDPTLNPRDDDLGRGDLVEGGNATGSVAFDAGAGTYFVIYKPDPFNAARGIWQIEVQ